MVLAMPLAVISGISRAAKEGIIAKDGIAIGQKMLHIAKQSIFFGIGGNFVLITMASFGYIPPATGAVMQEVLNITVVLNMPRAR